MANLLYPKFRQARNEGGATHDLSAGTVKAALIDTGTYTYSATHEFFSSITGVVGTAVTLTSKVFTDGKFDSADVTFSAVTGNNAEAILLYIDTGTAGTSRLVALIDTVASGLPVLPNGGDVNVAPHATGWWD